MTRRRALLAVAVLVVLSAAVTVVIRSQPREYNARLDGYACVSGDPRFLRIFSVVGFNDYIVSTRARQDRDEVTVTVRAVDPEPPDQFQQLSGHPMTTTVVLSEALGDRLVVDHHGRTLQGQCP